MVSANISYILLHWQHRRLVILKNSTNIVIASIGIFVFQSILFMYFFVASVFSVLCDYLISIGSVSHRLVFPRFFFLLVLAFHALQTETARQF